MGLLTEHQKRALNYKNHISLTANAGSGKTFVLSKRYLQIALNENISLRNIAAITFTDKAAGELYKKIANEIDECYTASASTLEKKKLESIRRQLVSSNISTIHSFCIDILKEFPIEANLDANFIPIDERLSNEFIELSIEESIKNYLRDDKKKGDLEYLIRIFSSKNILAKQIASLIKQRKNVLAVKRKIYHESDSKIAEYFYNSFAEYSEKIFGSRSNSILNIIDEINQVVLSTNQENILAIEVSAFLNEARLQEDFLPKLNLLTKIKNKISTKDGTIKKIGYLAAKLRVNLEEKVNQLESFIDDLEFIQVSDNHNELELALAVCGKKIISFFDEALELYSKKKRENGYLDYEDILLHTQATITNESVRNALSEKYKYLLIDEYQDTNEIQYNIFLPILEELKKGNLFVVGDEKQSIYMFRDAELEVFNRTKKNIEEIDGNNSLLSLPDSFRMSPELCLFTNVLFRNLFSDPNELYNEVHHSDLVCAVDEKVKGKIEILISKNNSQTDYTEGSESLSEPELVARRILQLVSQGGEEKISWQDIAILCRKRKSFKQLEEVFIRFKIPFLILGGRDFYQRQMIYDVYNYFSFLLDENNDAALIGFLRSPFCLLSDPDIFQISMQPGINFYNKLIAYCEKNIAAKKKTETLYEIKNKHISADFVFLLRKIFNTTNYLAVAAAKPDGEQELANIKKLIQLTINYHSQGFKTLYDYVNFLKDSIENSYDEAQAAVADDSNAIKLMTLHQAKGLEFPVVFLFDSNDSTSPDLTKSKSISVDKNFGLLTKLPYKEDYFAEYVSAPIVGVNDLINKRKNLAELKRLFYVGVTRAKKYLIISAALGKELKLKKDSFIGLLTSGLNINLDEQEAVIKSELTFLKSKEEKYFNETKNLELNIPIVSFCAEAALRKDSAKTDYLSKKIMIANVSEESKGEIISATKYAVYSQCQLKYHLSFDLGLNSFFENMKSNERINLKKKLYNFKDEETETEDQDEENNLIETSGFAAIKGRIIHTMLEREVDIESFESMWNEASANYSGQFSLQGDVIAALKSEIKNTLEKYSHSQIFKEIKKYYDYKNEFEVYSKEDVYFLHGIIDKIIFDGPKIIIVDYKTDELRIDEIEEKSYTYINQLKFYSYIVSRLFPDVPEIKLFLIFLEHPGKFITFNLSQNDFKEIKNNINLMLQNISQQVYPKNLNHCKKCRFSINSGRCIKA